MNYEFNEKADIDLAVLRGSDSRLGRKQSPKRLCRDGKFDAGSARERQAAADFFHSRRSHRAAIGMDSLGANFRQKCSAIDRSSALR